jgi:hypothetical protein
MGLHEDFLKLAADDACGKKLQDLELLAEKCKTSLTRSFPRCKKPNKAEMAKLRCNGDMEKNGVLAGAHNCRYASAK